MYTDNSELAGGFFDPRTYLKTAPAPTPIVSKEVGIEMAKVIPVSTTPIFDYPAPQPKPTYIPPVVAPIAPIPVVNIQQPPIPKKAGLLASPWVIPAMIGGAGLLLVVALGGKK